MEKDIIIRPEMDEELKKLRASRQGAGSLLITAIIGLLFSFVMLFLTDLRTACMIGLAALAFDMLIGRPSRKRRAKRLVADQALFGIGSALSACSYCERSELPNDILRQLSLSDRSQWPVKPVCRHLLRGRYISSAVTLCECSVGVKWGERKGSVDFLSGTLFTADGGGDAQTGAVCFSLKAAQASDDYRNYYAAGYRQIMSGRGELDKNAVFLVRNTDRLPDWMASGAERLIRDGDSAVIISFVKGELAVFLINSFFAHRMHSGTQATEALLKECRLKERDALFDMARKMQQFCCKNTKEK